MVRLRLPQRDNAIFVLTICLLKKCFLSENEEICVTIYLNKIKKKELIGSDNELLLSIFDEASDSCMACHRNELEIDRVHSIVEL